MSAVIAVPDLMAQAATDLARIGDTLNAAHMTAATRTIAVPPAAADEVSASIAHLFSGHATEYQKLAGQAAAFHDQFVQHLTASASAYASAEAANVSLLTADAAASNPLLDPFFINELPFYIGVLAVVLVLISPLLLSLPVTLPIVLLFAPIGLVALLLQTIGWP